MMIKLQEKVSQKQSSNLKFFIKLNLSFSEFSKFNLKNVFEELNTNKTKKTLLKIKQEDKSINQPGSLINFNNTLTKLNTPINKNLTILRSSQEKEIININKLKKINFNLCNLNNRKNISNSKEKDKNNNLNNIDSYNTFSIEKKNIRLLTIKNLKDKDATDIGNILNKRNKLNLKNFDTINYTEKPHLHKSNNFSNKIDHLDKDENYSFNELHNYNKTIDGLKIPKNFLKFNSNLFSDKQKFTKSCIHNNLNKNVFSPFKAVEKSVARAYSKEKLTNKYYSTNILSPIILEK